MKPITRHEITPLRRPVQHFSDCYLCSSIGALARSEDGQKILSQNIAHRKDGFRVRFQEVDDYIEDYFVSSQEIENLVSLDKYYNEVVHKYKQQPILKAIELAMDKLIRFHPHKKSLINRLGRGQEKFEYNYPSNFLEMFTGKKPIVLNEGGFRMNLKKCQDRAIELFERIDKADDFSFVAGTGLRSREGLTTVHCYTVEGVNKENHYIQIFDCRLQESIVLPFNRAITALKFLTGYLR